jgi:hypothetical protein
MDCRILLLLLPYSAPGSQNSAHAKLPEENNVVVVYMYTRLILNSALKDFLKKRGKCLK